MQIYVILSIFVVMKRPIIIAIDGHSSTGKSTVAKLIARQLGYVYIDTGAMYRAISLGAMSDGLVSEDGVIDTDALAKSVVNYDIAFRNTGEGGRSETYLNGENVEREIRTMRVSQMVSKVATLPFVRSYVDSILHKIGEARGVVMDGRDIGTAVFPDAEFKLFMTADACVRARRRFDELKAKGENPDFEEVLANVRERDYLDEHRDVSPLRRAEDAVLLDNSTMTVEEEVEWIMKKLEDEGYDR